MLRVALCATLAVSALAMGGCGGDGAGQPPKLTTAGAVPSALRFSGDEVTITATTAGRRGGSTVVADVTGPVGAASVPLIWTGAAYQGTYNVLPNATPADQQYQVAITSTSASGAVSAPLQATFTVHCAPAAPARLRGYRDDVAARMHPDLHIAVAHPRPAAPLFPWGPSPDRSPIPGRAMACADLAYRVGGAVLGRRGSERGDAQACQ